MSNDIVDAHKVYIEYIKIKNSISIFYALYFCKIKKYSYFMIYCFTTILYS